MAGPPLNQIMSHLSFIELANAALVCKVNTKFQEINDRHAGLTAACNMFCHEVKCIAQNSLAVSAIDG